MMAWFRSHARSTALTALFALLLQLTLSFGHVHLGHAADHDVVLTQAEPTSGEDPPSPPGSHHEDHYCPIYAVLHLIGAAQAATPPALPPPPRLGIGAPALAAATLAAQMLRLAFRSRAPPLT